MGVYPPRTERHQVEFRVVSTIPLMAVISTGKNEDGCM